MKTTPLAAGAMLALAALLLGACQQQDAQTKGDAAASAAPEAKPGMTLSEGRLVLPAVKGNPAAAYFTLSNGGQGTVSVAAVAVTGAGKTEVHQTVGGTMSKVDSLDIDPGTTVKLEPGALHVMAFELDPKLAAGGTTEVTVTFADGDKLSAPLKIEARGAAMEGMDHGGMNH